MLFSVLYECSFYEECFLEGNCYKAGDIDYFACKIEADGFYSAVDRALDFAYDHFSDCDVSIKSIIRL